LARTQDGIEENPLKLMDKGTFELLLMTLESLQKEFTALINNAFGINVI